jgi:hypothetical protein
MKFKGSLICKEKIVQSRSWQLIIPYGWDNLEAIKERCRGISRNYYFICHEFDKNELGEPVKPHWHLLLAFAAARQLGTMQNYFKEWGNFDEPKKDKNEIKKKEAPEIEIGKSADLENEQQLLRPNSFERVYSLDGARRYLVHSEDPNKYQYSPLQVETNDKLFINLFLPKSDEITATKNVISSFKKLALCTTFDEFLSEFEGVMYTMSNAQRITHVIGLRRYYNEYRNNLYNTDGFDKIPPGVVDDGFTPVIHETLYKQKELENLPF